MASSLRSLPMELLEAILRNLETVQLLAVGLACRELNLRSLHLVGPAYFSTVSTDLSFSSMNRLEALATESPFGPYVRTLHIDSQHEQELGNGFEWPRHMALRQSTIRQRQDRERQYGFHTLDIHLCPGFLKLRHLLASQLTNCLSFSLEKDYTLPQYSHLDGLQDGFITPLDVVAIILSLSTGPSCLPITSIALRLTSAYYGHVIEHQDYGNVDFFHTALPNLESLAFHHDLNKGAEETWWKCITSILSRATMLKHLKLGSLRAYDYLNPVCNTDCLHSLVSLELTSMELLTAGFQDFLYRSQWTLKSLCLSRIHIAVLHGSPEAWPKLLRNMSHSLSVLEEITIDKLSAPYGCACELDFGEELKKLGTEVGIMTVQAETCFFGTTGIHGATFKGPGMKYGLESLARAFERGVRT